MASQLVNAFKAAQKKAAPMQINVVRPVTTFLTDPKDWEKLVDKIAEAHPDLQARPDLATKQGLNSGGMPIMLAYLGAGKANGQPARNVSIWGSGKVTWTNLEPISL